MSQPVLSLETLAATPVARRRIELVERKGLGHPDTMCDSLVEAASVALARLYLAQAGRVLHYNLDKAMLVAGQCSKGFGWGRVTQPMTLIVGDRATIALEGQALPVEETVRAAAEAWMAQHLPHVEPGKDFVVRSVLAPGSEELRGIFAEAAPEPIANDTCGACGFAPLSPVEALVLGVEHFLNGQEFKAAFPDTGQDVKVFAVRDGDHVRLTVAMPLRAAVVGSEAAYFHRKEQILAALVRRFADLPFTVDWALNHLDRPGRGAAGTYLTVTGTSAEDADSGQVGRGNRPNGLIAYSRPTGGEAAAGKNAVAHVGKIYSVLSHRLAGLVHRRCPEVLEVYVHLAARIGDPVDRPWTAVQLVLPEGLALADVAAAVRDVVDAELERLPAFRAALARGDYPVC